MITETLQLSRKQILLSSVLATIVLGTAPIQMQAEIIPNECSSAEPNRQRSGS